MTSIALGLRDSPIIFTGGVQEEECIVTPFLILLPYSLPLHTALKLLCRRADNDVFLLGKKRLEILAWES